MFAKPKRGGKNKEAAGSETEKVTKRGNLVASIMTE
jgi:hypothetical protein